MNGVALALQLLLELVAKAGAVSEVIRKAREEGREDLSAAEWKTVLDADAAARQALVDAIAKAKAEGR